MANSSLNLVRFPKLLTSIALLTALTSCAVRPDRETPVRNTAGTPPTSATDLAGPTTPVDPAVIPAVEAPAASPVAPIATDASSATPSPTPVVVDWSYVNEKVFKSSCLRCHSNARSAGGVNVETFATAKASIDLIRSAAIVEASMPPRGPLADDLKGILDLWISAGAPESTPGAAVPAPTPPSAPETPDVIPSPAPVPPAVVILDWATVNESVFKTSCVKCHSASHGAGGVKLDTYEAVKANLLLISKVAIEERTMPPRKPLDTEPSALLKAWIDAGAPETASAQ